MLKTKPRKSLKSLRRNPDSKEEKEKARQREIADFIATKGVKKYPYDREGKSPLHRPGTGTRLKERENCQLCGSWTDDSGEYRHYDWCPTYKKSRKNPITTRKSLNSLKNYRNLIEVDTAKTSKNHIFLTYQGKEIEFTGKDAEDLRDIMKYQLTLFRGSTKLQRLFPKHLDDAGGFNTYITEQLQKVYPEVFR